MLSMREKSIKESAAMIGNVVAVRLCNQEYSNGRRDVGVVYDVMPTGGIKVVTEYGIIMHSSPLREYWIEHDRYHVKCRRNMGLSSVPILPLLDTHRMQNVDQTFNPKSTDINKMSLKTALELCLKDSARTGISC